KLAAANSEAASFETGDLTVKSVSSGGVPLKFVQNGKRTDVGVPNTGSDSELVFDYEFKSYDTPMGWSSKHRASSTSPYYCGNLFPCKSAPSEGSTYTLNVTGVPAGETAVYAKSIPVDAP